MVGRGLVDENLFDCQTVFTAKGRKTEENYRRPEMLFFPKRPEVFSARYFLPTHFLFFFSFIALVRWLQLKGIPGTQLFTRVQDLIVIGQGWIKCILLRWCFCFGLLLSALVCYREKVRLKCRFGNDIRTVIVNNSTSIAE